MRRLSIYIQRRGGLHSHLAFFRLMKGWLNSTGTLIFGLANRESRMKKKSESVRYMQILLFLSQFLSIFSHITESIPIFISISLNPRNIDIGSVTDFGREVLLEHHILAVKWRLKIWTFNLGGLTEIFYLDMYVIAARSGLISQNSLPPFYN